MDIASTTPLVTEAFTSLGTAVLTILGLFIGFALALIVFRYGWGKMRKALKH